jgi:hypothetical protein
MPAVSQAQQALMAQALGIKTGSLKPADLDPKYKDKIVSLAKKMDKKELEKYAFTKRKGLPHHVNEEDEININEDSAIATQVPVMKISGASEYTPSGPGTIVPFLSPEVIKKKKGKKNLENLKDYRDWIGNNGK